jgi:hypothetical protein
MDIVEGEVAPRGGDANGDEEADTIGIAGVDDEVAVDSLVAIGDEVADVAADGAAAAAGPERIGSGRRRTPPALMLRWTLPIARSIPPRKPEKAERDEKGCGVNSNDPKQIESSTADEGGTDDDDANADVAGAIRTADVVP